MEQITIRMQEDTLETVDKETGESDASRSEVVRNLIQLGLEHEELQTELEQKEAKVKELRNQLQARGDVEEKIDTLVEKTERQDDALAQVLERQQRGVFGRTKRWLFGKKDSEEA
jgi:metal-responsive CopG/Arc/MetJ family transcriptional regulator